MRTPAAAAAAVADNGAGAAAKLGWIAAYLDHLGSQRQLSVHTTAAYGRDLRELAELAELSGKQDWQQLTQPDIRRLTAKLHSRQLDPRSIARKLSSWRGFFSWLSLKIDLPANPVDGVRAPRRAKTLPRALSVDDAVHLVAHTATPHAGAAPEPVALCNR